MKNLITKKQYNKIKNEQLTVITFRNDKRVLTHIGLSYIGAVKEVIHKQGRNYISFIIPNDEYRAFKGNENNIEELQAYLNK